MGRVGSVRCRYVSFIRNDGRVNRIPLTVLISIPPCWTHDWTCIPFEWGIFSCPSPSNSDIFHFHIRITVTSFRAFIVKTKFDAFLRWALWVCTSFGNSILRGRRQRKPKIRRRAKKICAIVENSPRRGTRTGQHQDFVRGYFSDAPLCPIYPLTCTNNKQTRRVKDVWPWLQSFKSGEKIIGIFACRSSELKMTSLLSAAGKLSISNRILINITYTSCHGVLNSNEDYMTARDL